MTITYSGKRARFLSGLAVLLFTGFLNGLHAQTLRFTVKVPEQYATKDYLSLATDNIENAGRYIVPGGFGINLAQNVSESYVRSIFETAGIPVISIQSVKSEAGFSTEKAGGVNCSSSQLLCSNTSQTANSSGHGIQELDHSNSGCLTTEHQSSWYYLNVQTGGNLTMDINPNNNADDYDFAIWGPFTAATAQANCPPTSDPVRCSYSSNDGDTGLNTTANDLSEGVGGNKWVKELSTSPNEIYILLVDNFSNSGHAYSMDFGGSSVLGCTPVILPVELSSFSVDHSSNGNLLSWTTQSEDRSDYFNVEWTTDPASGDWTEIAKVYAAGQSTSELSYSALHSSPSDSKINYYRLSQTDLDGVRTTYGNRILSAAPETKDDKIVHIYSLLGQEVNQDYHGIVIYQYADGTTRKVNQ